MTSRSKCFECYGSRTGVCKNTNTVFRDKGCEYYVDNFSVKEHNKLNRRKRNDDGVQR